MPSSRIAVALAAIVLASCARSAPEVENVVLPSGAVVKVIGMGAGPAIDGAPSSMGLRYESDADFGDAQALHREALEIWRFFRFQAEGKGYQAAILTAETPAQDRSASFTFEKRGGGWVEVDRNGQVVGAPLAHLQGAMAAFAWMTGTWNCDFRFSADGFTKAHPTVIVNEPDDRGTTIVQTYSESFGPGAVLGETRAGYDAARRVWYRHGRQTPNTAENDEAHGPYARDMTYTGSTRTGDQPPMQVRKRMEVDAAGTTTHLATQALIGGQWLTVAKGGCKKS